MPGRLWSDPASGSLFIFPPRACAGQWGLLGFTTFWLGFVTFWTAGALGMFGGQNHNVAQVGSGHIAFAAFSTPFWLAGFGMLGGVIWALARKPHRIFQRIVVRDRTPLPLLAQAA